MTGAQGTGPSAIMVVVPTTGGPVILRSLRPRAGLPASAAFAEGDYRPLPWSADYARLCAPDGPLSRLAGCGAPPVPHELRLTGSFDAGRSWEVPVCLAHGLVARGHRLTADPAQADLILWSTGAVDLDLAVLPGDYALLDKIERSRALIESAPQAGLAFLLPDGPERAEAERTIRVLGHASAPILLPSESVASALHALLPPADPQSAASPPRARSWRLALPVVAFAGLSAAVALGALPAPLPEAGTAEPPTVSPPAADTTPSQAEPLIPPEPERKAEAGTPAIRVEELTAPAGSSCRRVAFGADPPERRPVPIEGAQQLRASRLTPELCGFAIGPSQPGTRIEVGPELRSAALPPARLPDGAQAYYLREGARQNLVYTVQAVRETNSATTPDAAGDRLVHRLVLR